MADLNKIAEDFGMSVCELAITMGYTRQGLYSAVKKHNSGSRMHEALCMLKTDSDRRYQIELRQVALAKECREAAIDELSTACGLISPVKRNAIDSVFRHIGKIKEIRPDGSIVLEGNNLTQKDIDSLSHIRINNITGQIFDDRSTHLEEKSHE